MVTMPGSAIAPAPADAEDIKPPPYQPEMGVQVTPQAPANPFDQYIQAPDRKPAQRMEQADTSWKERFVQHFNAAQDFGTPGVDELKDIQSAKQGYVNGQGIGSEAGKATADLMISRRQERQAQYDAMKPSSSAADYSAAILGSVAGALADPASLLNPAAEIGTAGWRMAYPMFSRLLDSSVSNAAMNASINAIVQAEEWGSGLRDSVDWGSLATDAAAGFGFGMPFGYLEGRAAREEARHAERTPAGPPPQPGPTPPPEAAAPPAAEPPPPAPEGLAPPTPEYLLATHSPGDLNTAQEALFGEVVGIREMTPEQIAKVDDYLNANKPGEIPQAPTETQGGLTNETPPVEPVKPDLSIDPSKFRGSESKPAVQIGGKFFVGDTHADALAQAVDQFGINSPEVKAFEDSADPMASIGIVKPKRGFVPGITGGKAEDLTAQISRERGPAAPLPGNPVGDFVVQQGTAPTQFAALEEKLRAEADAAVAANGNRSNVGGIEQAIRDAVVAPIHAAGNRSTVEGMAAAEMYGRADLADYIATRAQRNAEATGTEPGVSKDSPKYETIKADLERRKAEELAYAADLRARADAIAKKSAQRVAPLPGAEQTPPAAVEPPPAPLPVDRTERQFNPSDLKVDAKRFQFKEGGDEAGVTDRLKGVKKWDPIKSGVTLVWEDLKGDFYIADGHQRHGLASRLEKEGQEPKIRAVVLREADGVTSEDARAIAAAKNIAEGTGNAIDAAKILRSRPDMAVDLPPTSALVRDAQGLANLSDDAFGMVINKKVPAGYAAQVGRLAPDPKTHAQLLDLLAKEQPDNAIEAESMIRDALDAPAVQSTMEDMFGSAEVTQILFKERAQVLSAAATAIRKDRAAFATLVKEEARLTGAGNTLATATNAERATQDAAILATLQAQARRKGPIADALAAAAKRLKDGDSRPAVVRDFLDELRTASKTIGPDGGRPGPVGRPDETGIAARLTDAGPTDSPAFKRWFGHSKLVDENGDPLVIYHGTGPTAFTEFKQGAGKRFDKGFFGADGFYLTPQRYLADAYSLQRGGTAANTMELYVSIQNPLWIHGKTSQPDEIVENFATALKAHFKAIAEKEHPGMAPKELYQNHIAPQVDEVMKRITGGKTALELQNDLFAEETAVRGEDAAAWDSHGGLHGSTLLDEFRKNIIPEVRKLGYDGIFAGDVFNKNYTHRLPSEVVAFDPTQIKSVNNRGTWDPTEPNIAFARRPPVDKGPSLFDVMPPPATTERMKAFQEQIRQRRQEMAAFQADIESAIERTGAFEGKTEDGRTIIVTQSLRDPSLYQVTHLDAQGNATGHMDGSRSELATLVRSNGVKPTVPQGVDGQVRQLKERAVRFASGMSRLNDFEAGAHTFGGIDTRGIGIDVQELSDANIPRLAQRILDWHARVFVDSGAFGLFRRNMREQGRYLTDLGDMFRAEGAAPPQLKDMDFQAVLDKYNELRLAIMDANQAEDSYPPPVFVAPDIIGDQAASLALLRQHADDLRPFAENLIVPLQKGEKTLAQAYAEARNILGTDFIAGIPSNEKAISAEEFRAFVKEAKPTRIHFLGAVADSKIEGRLKILAEEGIDPPYVAADGNILRSALYGKPAEGATRSQQISSTLQKDPAFQAEVNGPTYEPGAPAAPAMTPQMERLLSLASGKLGAPNNILGDQINQATRMGWIEGRESYTATGNRVTRYFLTDKGRETLMSQPKAPILEPGADNKPQMVIPGAEQISNKSLAERRAEAPLRAKRPQKGMDVGLFGSEADQKGFAFKTDAIGTGLPDMLANGAPIDEIAAHPFVQDAVRRLDAIPLTNEQPGFMSDAWKQSRVYDFPDGPVHGFDPAIDRLVEGANAFSTKGPVKHERRATIVLGPPAAGKSTFADRFAADRYAAIVDPDEAKKVIPEFHGGIGANAVHEESADMANAVLARMLTDGSNIVVPKVGHNPDGIRKLVKNLQAFGYKVDLINIAVTYDNAFRRMIGRFIKTGRIINPEYVKAVGVSPAETYRVLRQEGVADRYAEIDANGRPGDPPQVTDDTGALEGLSGFGGDRKPLDGQDVQGAVRQDGGNPTEGIALARRPQQSTMPTNRPQAGTVQVAGQATPELAPRLEDISAELQKLTGAPVRQGRLARAPKGGGRIAGQYDRGQGVIRLREVSDFETQTHETAHSMETQWGRSLNTIKLAHAKELEPLAYAGADPKQQLSEGFAEWFRFYVTTPAYARNSAPQFTKAFEDMLRTKAPEQLASIQAIAEAYRQHVTAPSQAAIAGDVVSSRRNSAAVELIKEAQANGVRATIATYASTAYTSLLDKLNPINKAVDELAKIYEKRTGRALDITSAQDPYRLARLLQDSYSAGHIDLVHGVVPYHGVTPEGPGLSDALEKALGDSWTSWDDRRVADFASYLISRRAVREYDRFLAGEIPNTPGKFTKGDYQTAIAELELAHPEFTEAADMVYEWQRNMLRKKYESGFLTQELYDDLIQRPDYVPFMRDLSDLDREVGREPNATLRNSIVKAFKGSKRSIINPIESMMTDAYHFNALMRRNDVFKALDDLAKMAGPGSGAIAERIPSTQLKGSSVDVGDVLRAAGKEAGINPGDIDALTTLVDDLLGDNAKATVFKAGEINEKGEPIIYVWRNGKKQALRLADGDFGRQLYDSMTGMNKESRDLFTSVLALPSSMLRYSITTAPPFILANYIRDQVSAWVLTGMDFIPFVSGARGLRDEIMQHEISQIYNTFGGIMGGANVAALDKGRVMRDLDALRKNGYAVRRFASIRGFAELTELSETGTRLAVFRNSFERAKKDGLTPFEAAVEAAYQARDYIDFGRHGSKTHAARRLVTFLNASVQGLDKAVRTLTAEGAIRKAITPYVSHRAGRPLSARDRANLGKSAKAWTALTAMGVFSLGLTALYRDDPEYEEISDYVRATHWMVKLSPGNWVAIPKPFELGFVANLFERGFDAVYKRNPLALESFVSGLYDVTAPPTEVPIFKVGYELAHNVDSFGQPIVGQDIAGFEPWRQYTARTSEIAKAMGYATNMSPAMIDHAIQGFGASWGQIITSASVDRAQERGVLETATNALSRRFIKQATSGAVSSRQFWDQMSEQTGPMAQTANTYKDILDSQGAAAANTFLESKNENLKAYALLTGNFDAKVERLHPMRRAKDAIAAISALRKEIAGNDVSRIESPKDDPEKITLTPDQRLGAQELLARLSMVEARNALITTGIKGWEQKKPMDADGLIQDIGTLSPALGEELLARYHKRKVYNAHAVQEVWPEVKSRVLQDGADADFSDLLPGMED